MPLSHITLSICITIWLSGLLPGLASYLSFDSAQSSGCVAYNYHFKKLNNKTGSLFQQKMETKKKIDNCSLDAPPNSVLNYY